MASYGSSFASSVVDLATASYYIGPRSEVKILENSCASCFSSVKPTIVFSLDKDASNEDVGRAVQSFRAYDDVFSDDFLIDTVVVQLMTGKASILQWETLDPATATGTWKPTRVITIHTKHALPPGPYFLIVDTTVAQAWRLFPDTPDAFATTFVPAHNDPLRFESVSVTTGDGLWRQVAIPSRLYATPTAAKPLAGKRISVKDNFKVAGIRTTQNNRAWVSLHGAENETADYVQKLVKLGAIVVGKTKMNAFASAEEATDQWIDYHAPFNPRCDEYQTPSGSTTGGSAALASYDWMDYSIGTDTTGSTRWPAARSGLYGLRASWGSTSLEGVYPSCRSMDAIGLLARDIDGLASLASHSMSFPQDSTAHLPKRILYCTDFLPHKNPAQNALVEEFVHGLEEYLGIKRIDISIPEKWAQCPPPEAAGKSLRNYTAKTGYNLFYYDGYNEYAGCRAEYEEKFKKPVFLGPYMRWKWDRGAEVTIEQKEQAKKELDVYRQWFYENILKAEEGGESDAVLILPCGSANPKYRDLPNPVPGPAQPYNLNYIAPMQRMP